MAAKRQRSENFTPDDKIHLLERIESRKNIVENKKTDKLSQQTKENAWMLITKEYNSIASIPRTTDNLKGCWDNLKKRYRNTIAKKSSDVKSGHVNEQDRISNKKIEFILTSVQDKCLSKNASNSERYVVEQEKNLQRKIELILNSAQNNKCQSFDNMNALNSEPLTVRNGDLDDDSPSCSSDDSLHSETLLKEYSDRWSLRKKIEDLERIENLEKMENGTSCDSKTDVPCVLMLTSHELDSDSQHSSKTFQFSPRKFRKGINLETNHNHRRNNRQASRKQHPKDMNSALAEAKLELVELTYEHAIAEERRKAELHELQIKKAKLEIQFMNLQVLSKKSQLLK